tara:strand:- start:5044 stop:6483 length:1440 start_codon:yes stop_codon:yes gene_type:complete
MSFLGIDIQQEPTSTNTSYTKLMYSVSSSRRDNPQFKYVADLYETGSSTRLGRFKTVPNSQNSGVFDFSVPIQGQLGYDNNWKATPALRSQLFANHFEVKFGEEYGTSPSSSVTVFNGKEVGYAEGDPAVESANLFIFQGVNNMVVNNSFNFPYSETFGTSSFTQISTVPSPKTGFGGPRLSNNPNGVQARAGQITYPTPISNIDWETIKILNHYLDEDMEYLSSEVSVFDGSGAMLNTGTVPTQFHLYTGSLEQAFVTLGVGPQSFLSSSDSAVSALFTGSWASYRVDVLYRGGTPAQLPLSSSYWYVDQDICGLEVTNRGDNISIQYNPTLFAGNYDTTRFAFINSFGAWDYYSINTPISKQTRIKRQNNIAALADYSGVTSTYDISKRSNTQFYAAMEDDIEITTEYIDQDTANWLTEMFESPSVFEQLYNEETLEYDFVPVIITNNKYVWDTNNREHTFQYTFRYKRANQRRSRI